MSASTCATRRVVQLPARTTCASPSRFSTSMRGVKWASDAAWLALLRRLINMAVSLNRPRPACRFVSPSAVRRGVLKPMARVLSVAAERFPSAGTFTISRGSKTEAEVIVCVVTEADRTGRGECVPYHHYGESIESVTGAIESVRRAIERGADRGELQR